MLIVLEVVMIVAPQVATVFFLVITLSLGVVGNNKWLPGEALKLSTRHWQTRLQNYPGSSHCVQKLAYDSLNLQHNGVIKLELLTYTQTQSSMHEQNI
jgi:hypothetical protein